MEKYALFAFSGEAMCFVHVLLNGLDLKAKGQEVKIIIEGSACRLIPELGEAGHPLHQLYGQARKAGLIAGACKACSQKMGSLEAARAQGLNILEDMAGHAGMAPYVLAGYRIITF
uniref:Cytoplasmic protein n=1 Tax=Desulfobacca acetoxidans TaxID=60893 RepID=A0A7C3UWZ0_9BACT